MRACTQHKGDTQLLRACNQDWYSQPVNTTKNEGIWPAYIEKVSGTISRRDIARATGVSPSAVSRWFTGDTQPTDAGNVAALAMAYGRSPVEAFVAAGLLDFHDAARGLNASQRRLLRSLSEVGPNLGAVAFKGTIEEPGEFND